MFLVEASSIPSVEICGFLRLGGLVRGGGGYFLKFHKHKDEPLLGLNGVITLLGKRFYVVCCSDLLVFLELWIFWMEQGGGALFQAVFDMCFF